MPANKERLVSHIKREYEAKGYDTQQAESIAWATVTKLEQDKEDESTESTESTESPGE